MSRYDAASDYDYLDEPWNRPEPCATPRCEHTCDIPSLSAFCYYCRCRHAIEDSVKTALTNEKAAQTKGTAA